MSIESSPSAIKTESENRQLAQGVLGVSSVTFQGLIGAGPAVAIALNISLGATLAGTSLPFIFLIGSLSILCVAVVLAQFSRHLPSAGSYFTFTSTGLGPIAGFVTGCSALLYGIAYPSVPILVLATLLPDYSKRLFGVEVPWYVWVIILLSIIWYAAYVGIRKSIRVAIVTGTVELAIVFLLVVATIIRAGNGNSLVPFAPKITSLSGALAGLVFVFLSFSGFESVANLAEEARQPRHSIGRAVIITIVILAVFYTAAAYGGLVGFHLNAQQLASDSNPFDTLIRQIANPLWALLALAFLNSGFGGGLAGMLVASRYIFAMGRIGLLPSFFGQVHPKHRTPAYAVHLVFLISLLLSLGLGLLFHIEDAFGFIATIFTVALLIMYLMSALALPVFFRRDHPNEFSLFWHILIPLVAAAVILAALFSLVYPTPPPAPISYAFPIAAVWLLIGIVIAIYLRLRHPQKLAESKHIFVPEDSL